MAVDSLEKQRQLSELNCYSQAGAVMDWEFILVSLGHACLQYRGVQDTRTLQGSKGGLETIERVQKSSTGPAGSPLLEHHSGSQQSSTPKQKDAHTVYVKYCKLECIAPSRR